MAPLYSLRHDGHKWIRAPKPELYDLVDDPHELANLYPDPDRLYAAMDAELERVFEDSKQRAIASRDNPMTRESMEMLQSLGYLQGADDRRSMGGMDPKDGILVYNRLEEARHLAQNEKWDQAEKKLRALVEEYPHHVSARSILALALLRLGRLDEARAEYQRLLVDDGDKARSYLMLASIALVQNKLDEAERDLHEALAASPGLVEAASNLGLVATLRGDEAGARRWYERAIAIDPTYPHAYRRIADVLYERKDYAEALDYYQRMLSKIPNDFHALVQAGNSARYDGHPADARSYYLRAQTLRPESWLPTYDLACLELAQGETDAAFERLQAGFDKGLPTDIPDHDADWKAWQRKARFKALLAKADLHRVRADD
jgi:tetratricopeptide (TPR) repeat protein